MLEWLVIYEDIILFVVFMLNSGIKLAVSQLYFAINFLSIYSILYSYAIPFHEFVVSKKALSALSLRKPSSQLMRLGLLVGNES